jgi:hypothetical protein
MIYSRIIFRNWVIKCKSYQPSRFLACCLSLIIQSVIFFMCTSVQEAKFLVLGHSLRQPDCCCASKNPSYVPQPWQMVEMPSRKHPLIVALLYLWPNVFVLAISNTLYCVYIFLFVYQHNVFIVAVSNLIVNQRLSCMGHLKIHSA